LGYHSEWNLGSPGGFDYQRINQLIGKAVWERLNRLRPIGLELDFDHPLLYPVNGFTGMLLQAHRARAAGAKSMIAVVAEEETLSTVTENINLARRINDREGVPCALMSPQELELKNDRVCYRGNPVAVAFVDFNTDVMLKLHREHGLAPLLQAVRENRVINPRGTEPLNAKSAFEVLTGRLKDRFSPDIVRRTPWTRQFYPRRTDGPNGEKIGDLIEWTRKNWDVLVLKPERGYSGKGVRVGRVHPDGDKAIELALKAGNYIVQEKIPLNLWAEDTPWIDSEREEVIIQRVQTDFRSLFGPGQVFGFLGRFGGVPTNVGSGGGVQPLAVLRSELSVREAARRINSALTNMKYSDVADVIETQKKMALDHNFTYLLGPIKIALRPRIITEGQLAALRIYCAEVWKACLTLEKMWEEGALDDLVNLEEEELEIARSQPWKGSAAIFASDGLFSFGSHPEAE